MPRRMGDQSSLEQSLQALRLAAERGDWNAWRGTPEALLLRLPASHAVLLVRDFIARRLPAFERHPPGVLWLRGLLEVLNEGDSTRHVWRRGSSLGARHPEEWARWYQLAWSEKDDGRMFELQLDMMSDPDVKSRKRAGWLEVAERLEAAILGGTGASGH